MFSRNDDPGIIFHGFEVEDLLKLDLVFFIPLLYNEGFRLLFPFKGEGFLPQQRKVPQPKGKPGKTLCAEGLQEIVEGLKFVAFDGKLGMRRDKNKQ